MALKIDKKTIFLHIAPLLFINLSFGQQAETDISFGNTRIASNELFNIILTIPDDKKKEIGNFPEIPDFIKKKTLFEKEEPASFKITQQYAPLAEGEFRLDSFSLFINGAWHLFPGTIIQVGPASGPNREAEEKYPENLIFSEQRPDAFFRVSSQKSSVYTREGIAVTAAFYIAAENRVEMNFIDLTEQISRIRKSMRPVNCWVEDIGNADDIEVVNDTLENKIYRKYIFYQGLFFPLDSTPVELKVPGFKMLVYQIARQPGYIARKEAYQIFSARPLTVKVKALPPHPFRHQVPAGFFRLAENISPSTAQTGEIVKLNLEISGEGNMALFGIPGSPNKDVLELYSGSTSGNYYREGNRIFFRKSWDCRILVKEPGEFPMDTYFNWIYFNVYSGKYDTLASGITLNVSGESLKEKSLAAGTPGSFYEMVFSQENKLRQKEKDQLIRIFANIALLFMLVTTAIFILKR